MCFDDHYILTVILIEQTYQAFYSLYKLHNMDTKIFNYKTWW